MWVFRSITIDICEKHRNLSFVIHRRKELERKAMKQNEAE